MSAVMATPKWEQMKENAAPLAQGRNVQKLSHALSTPQCTSSSHQGHAREGDKNIRNFERLIRPTEKFASMYSECDPPMRNHQEDVSRIDGLLQKCGIHHDSDPMVDWARYIKYHEETYPSDTHAQFLLMERCTQALFHHPKYRNDVRFIRVCVLYADRTSDPHEQFKIFHKHKIGSEVAIFWLAWAWVAETKKDFPFAEKIFKKAIQKKAKPEKIISQRYNQFQRRMSRHWLNAANGNDAREVESVYDGEEENNSNNYDKRGALSGLTEEGVRQNHRGRGANNMAMRSTRNRSMMAPPSLSSSNNGRPPKSGGFVIFADENDDDGRGGYDLNQSAVYGDENVPLPRMVREQDKKKENELAPEAWNERGGLRRPGHGHGYAELEDRNIDDNEGASSVVQRWAGTDNDGTNALGVPSQSAFQVFVDEECADDKTNRNDTAKRGKQGKLSDRVLRQRPEEGIKGREPLGPTRGILKESSMKPHDTKRSSRGMPPKRSNKEPNPAASKSKSQKDVYGFEEKLVAKDRNGSEGCFELYRAKKRLFKIAPSGNDFNLLHKVQSTTPDDSCMDIDDGSTVEDVDMEDASVMSYSMSIAADKDAENETSCDVAGTSTGGLDARERLDNLDGQHINQSYSSNRIGNRSLNISRGHNTSTASSTVDEQDAVGVVGDREETLNTKFAARELSMMFSSPAGAMGANNKSKLLFSIHHDAEEESCDEESINNCPQNSKNQQPAGFSIFCDEEASPKQQERGAGMFTIYDECEDKNVDKIKSNHQPAMSAGGFGIYEDSDEETDEGKDGKVKGSQPALAGGFDIYEDSDDSSDESSLERSEARNGDTASLADLMEIMKDTSPAKSGKSATTSLGKKRPQQLSNPKSGELAIFCDEEDNGTVLTEDTAAFGDISFIPYGESDTCNLQDKMKGLSVASSGGRGGRRGLK